MLTDPIKQHDRFAVVIFIPQAALHNKSPCFYSAHYLKNTRAMYEDGHRLKTNSPKGNRYAY